MTNHEGHVLMWDKMAKKGYKSIKQAFRYAFGGNVKRPLSICFTCEEALIRMEKNKDYIGEHLCRYCPIDWVEGKINSKCIDPESPYYKWRKTKNKEEKQYLAGIIRDLPWK